MAEDQTTLFQKSWGIYDALAAENYMFHRELTSLVAEQLLEVSHCGGWSLLDLGCGNGRFLAPALPQRGPQRYLGVDLSGAAIEEARGRYLKSLDHAQFLQADMTEALWSMPGPWDVIYSSFAIHHLDSDEKMQLLELASAALAPGGRMIWVDVFRTGGESREQYLAKYLANMRQNWRLVSAADLDAACEHVAQYDFPEPLENLASMAAAAGFGAPKLLGAFGPHHALTLSAAKAG